MCKVVGGIVIVILLPLVATTVQPASWVFTHFETSPAITGIKSPVYAVLLSWLVSQYSLFGYDAAAHLTEETRGADINGPIAILSSIGLISVVGWGFMLSLTFSIKVSLDLGNISTFLFLLIWYLHYIFSPALLRLGLKLDVVPF